MATVAFWTRRRFDDWSRRGPRRAAGFVEAVKWGHPRCTHAGHKYAVLGALRADFRVGVFTAGLMTDPQGLGLNQRQPARGVRVPIATA